MTRTVPAAILTHMASGTTSMVYGIWIQREDGETYRYTEHDVDDDITGISVAINGRYLHDPGFSVSEIALSAGLDVGNMEIRAQHDGSIFTTADLFGDRWRNAAFLVFQYNHRQDPITDIIECLAGTFGEVELRSTEVVIELHDLRRYMNQPVGDQSSRTCRARLGDARCALDITSAPFTMPFTVTHVTSATRAFRDSARGEVDDYFGEGEVRWLTGDNAGLASKVKTYAADGTFTLALPVPLPIQVGDTGTAIVGCRKRRTEDCAGKFDNVLNNQSEPDRRGEDEALKPPTPTDLSAAVISELASRAF